MSWSVSGLGKPGALAEKLAADFACIPPMSEPEETGKNAAAAAVAAIVPAFPPSSVVRVECYGSQYVPDANESLDEKINQLSIKIDSLGTIVE